MSESAQLVLGIVSVAIAVLALLALMWAMRMGSDSDGEQVQKAKSPTDGLPYLRLGDVDLHSVNLRNTAGSAQPLIKYIAPRTPPEDAPASEHQR